MNNEGAVEILESCKAELDIVKATLVGLGNAPVAPYLKKYCVIRASGGIEAAFKKIIADKVDDGGHEQIKNFVRLKVRETSRNPHLDAIESVLGEFDPRWRRRFGELTGLADKPRLKTALSDLVKARNKFAHGGDTDMSIEVIIEHFSDGMKVMEFLDEAVNHQFEEAIEDDSMDHD